MSLVLALLLLVGGLLWWTTRPPGNSETDRIATVVASAIVYPRSHSADDYLGMVLSKTAARDGRLSVVRVERLPATQLTEPMVHMVWRVHLQGSESGWIRTDPVTACYEVAFSYYGATLGPRRTMCPPGDPLTVVPGPPVVLPSFPEEASNPLSPAN